MKKNIILIVAILTGFGFLLPLWWMLRASFLPDTEVVQSIPSILSLFSFDLRLQNYHDVFRRVSLFRTLFVSFAFCSVIVIAGLFINSACGFAFARLQFPGSKALFIIVSSLIIIPFEAISIPLFLLLGVKLNLMNSLPGLFLPYLAKAFNIYYLRQFYLSLPHELEEAARVEGASWVRIYFQIALPLSKPALATCAILDFTAHWSEYFWPLIMTNKPEYETIQVGLAHFYTLPPIQWGDIMAYSVMATIPMIIIFTFFQRYLVLSSATSGIKA